MAEKKELAHMLARYFTMDLCLDVHLGTPVVKENASVKRVR